MCRCVFFLKHPAGCHSHLSTHTCWATARTRHVYLSAASDAGGHGLTQECKLNKQPNSHIVFFWGYNISLLKSTKYSHIKKTLIFFLCLSSFLDYKDWMAENVCVWLRDTMSSCGPYWDAPIHRGTLMQLKTAAP